MEFMLAWSFNHPYLWGTTPIGIEFFGRPFDETGLIALAYAYEQATLNRLAPVLYPPLEGETIKSVSEPGFIPTLTMIGISALGVQCLKQRKQQRLLTVRTTNYQILEAPLADILSQPFRLVL